MLAEIKISNCMDYAASTDDGKGLSLYHRANVIVISPYGVGKTKICEQLAFLGFNAANLPFIISKGEILSIGAAGKKDVLRNLVQARKKSGGGPLVVGLYFSFDTIEERREVTKRWEEENKVSDNPVLRSKLNSDYIKGIQKEIGLLTAFLDELGCETVCINKKAPRKVAKEIEELLDKPYRHDRNPQASSRRFAP